ncbi:hypothetical protein BC833DRAFT_626420 [Globomyces pollinis-pini]|nr:hypothetical protein BC833DRAFT_626420 [Globomyces pollinis-pini]
MELFKQNNQSVAHLTILKYENSRLFKLKVACGGDQIDAIELYFENEPYNPIVLGNFGVAIEKEKHEDNIEFEFKDEKIVECLLWPNNPFTPTRLGGIYLRTNKGRETCWTSKHLHWVRFNAHKVRKNSPGVQNIPVESGIIIGVNGGWGKEIDSFSFAFVQNILSQDFIIDDSSLQFNLSIKEEKESFKNDTPSPANISHEYAREVTNCVKVVISKNKVWSHAVKVKVSGTYGFSKISSVSFGVEYDHNTTESSGRQDETVKTERTVSKTAMGFVLQPRSHYQLIKKTKIYQLSPKNAKDTDAIATGIMRLNCASGSVDLHFRTTVSFTRTEIDYELKKVDMKEQ